MLQNDSSHTADQVAKLKGKLIMSTFLKTNLYEMLVNTLDILKVNLQLDDATINWMQDGEKWMTFSSSVDTIEDIEAQEDDVIQHQCGAHNYKFTALVSKTYKYEFPIPLFGTLYLKKMNSQLEQEYLKVLIEFTQHLATVSLEKVQQYTNKILTDDGQKRLEQTILDICTFEQFFKAFQEFLSLKKNTSRYSAVIYIDFDRFGSAKEVLRFSFNNELLKQVKVKFEQKLDREFILSKVDNNILAVLVKNISDCEIDAFEYISRMLEQISRTLTEPIDIDSFRVFLTFKAGVKLFNLSGFNECEKDSVRTILKQTEFAMDSVPADADKPYKFFSQELLTKSKQLEAIENELSQALFKNEFKVFYQPIYNRAKIVIGAEALLRWESEKLGNVPPNEFIPVAENNGSIVDIGYFVAEQVFERLTANASIEAEKSIDYISINVSSIQFKHPLFFERMCYLLDKHPLASKRLRIEITESVAITNLEPVKAIMKQLKSKGVDFMLDDFGTGYSSLGYLHELSLRTIKIDRSFIGEIRKSKKKQAIALAIINLCKHFSLECIVEGVEEIEDFEYLSQFDIVGYQGFLFSKPLSCDDFVKILS